MVSVKREEFFTRGENVAGSWVVRKLLTQKLATNLGSVESKLFFTRGAKCRRFVGNNPSESPKAAGSIE